MNKLNTYTDLPMYGNSSILFAFQQSTMEGLKRIQNLKRSKYRNEFKNYLEIALKRSVDLRNLFVRVAASAIV